MLVMETALEQKIMAQAALCDEKGLPHFAPRSGRCFSCNEIIYQAISLESAGKNLITGCPLCHRSYCS